MAGASKIEAVTETMRKGFTLVELLVVLAIIAVLMGILLPVLAHSREKARQTACLSNLQQMAAATLQYAQDWDDTLPMSAYESVDALGRPCLVSVGCALRPYLSDRRLLVCPTNPDAYNMSQHARAIGLTGGECGGGRGGGSYALNEAVFTPGDAPHLGISAHKPMKLSWLRYPSETALGYDGNVAMGGECGFLAFEPALEGRHFYTDNVSFLDGHAKALRAFPSGCVTRNINEKPLTEYCLGGLAPYHRLCTQQRLVPCVHHLTGWVERDEQGLCITRPR